MIRLPGVRRISKVAWRQAYAGVGVALALAVAAAGCASGSGDNPADTLNPDRITGNNYDADCTAAENQGDRCTKDCVDVCGFDSRGSKYCTCQGGVYIQCACTPPETWKGAPTAPYCDRLTADPHYMDAQFCAVPSEECLSSAPLPTGATEQVGCRCVLAPGATAAKWTCKTKSELSIPETAPDCLAITNGKTDLLKDRPCDSEWQQCIARDFFDGSSPRGCVCLMQGTSLSWNCTGTNRWFRAE